jgi:hypothetical protein
MDKTQLRRLIREHLYLLEPEVPYSLSAEELLMMSCAVESNLGEFIKQIDGIALGIFQMEQKTEDDIWENYLAYKPKLREKVLQLHGPHIISGGPYAQPLAYNLGYQITMARLHYRRFSEPLPFYWNVEGLAQYWKKYYNTKLGKGTVKDAINKYERLVQQ